MTIALILIAGFALVLTLLYHRVSIWSWNAIIVAALATWVLLSDQPAVTGILSVFVYGLLVLPISLPFIRRKLLTRQLFKLFKRLLPPMSQTEREALEAGNVWWDAQLFSGKPDWNMLFDYPAPTLTAEEQAFIDGPTKELCRLIDDWEITHLDRRLPDAVWQYMREHKFFGMIIPKRYDGLEFSALAHSTVIMNVASRSVSAAVTVMVPNSLGPAELLLEYGTDEQRDHYLPRLARGEEIPCFALTGPEAGSDAGAMPDVGIVCKGMFDDKPDVLGIRLNWNKRYITLAPVATLLGLAFKLKDPDHLLGDEPDLGITVALIPVSTPGVVTGRRHYPLNMAFQNGPTEGKDVFIPIDWIIGGPERAGQGWRMLMESLAVGRSISLPALSTGSAKLASRATGAYARIRTQFGLPIGKFAGVEEVLARIAGQAYLMDAARFLTVTALDQGERPSVISAILKYQLTERMRIVINDAMDIQGGSGICLGPRNLFGRAYQALPIGITVEGANILTRNLIIFGQGAVRCHPHVLTELHAAQNPDEQRGLVDFDRALFAHMGMTISNAVRSLLLGLTSGRLAQVPVQGAARRYVQQLTRMSAAFALMADAAMLTLGGALKRRENLSARLADVLSLLYLCSATVKRFEDQGRLEEDIPLLKWACHNSFYAMQEAMHGFLRNMPNKPVAFFLRWLVFPRGRPYSDLYDEVREAAAALLLAPSEARDRLTIGVFVDTDINTQMGRLEDALVKVTAAEPYERLVKHALRDGKLAKDLKATELSQAAVDAGVLKPEEGEILQQAIEARLEVIQVDDFEPDLGIPVSRDQVQAA
ncbi:MAG: acyl-CoA dehydrogenase FadE [Gammaproteobacteria bacterium]|nr:MAG: acyl-CoA dehydrogenase FadE [Gammaproteobacteria bacterium]